MNSVIEQRKEMRCIRIAGRSRNCWTASRFGEVDAVMRRFLHLPVNIHLQAKVLRRVPRCSAQVVTSNCSCL